MTSSKVPRSTHGDGSVYFCYDSASDSFSGILDDDDRLLFDDEAVKEFIQYSKPELFERLHGLPFKSSDIAQSFRAQRLFKKTSQVQQAMNVKSQGRRAEVIPKHHAYETLDSSPQHTSNSRASCEMLELQLKRHVQICLLNGHSLILQKLPLSHNPLVCSSPTCPFNSHVFSNTFYLTLMQGFFPGGYTSLREVPNQSFYCLGCLEDVFDGKENALSDTMEQTSGATFDGVDHHAIITAASRLYQSNRTYLPMESELRNATKVNMDLQPPLRRAFEFRLEKQQEIETTLIEVNKYEKVRLRSQEPVDLDASPNMTIDRPWYMEAARYRYKKQGLGRYDKVKATRLERERSCSSPHISPVSSLSDESNELRCYCREPDLGIEDMVRCTNEWCSIGWFHLRCTGLQNHPPEDARFVCKNCQDDLGPFKMFNNDAEVDKMLMRGDLGLKIAGQLEEEEYQKGNMADDEADTDGEVTSLVQEVLPWGTPINPPNLSIASSDNRNRQTPLNDSICAFTEHQPFPIYHPPNTDLSSPVHLDGFTPINPTPSSQFTYTSGSKTACSSTSDPQSNIPRILFTGSTDTTFTDLAPFITAEDLSTEENEVFELWKFSAPPSRLVKKMMRQVPLGEWSDEFDDDADLQCQEEEMGEEQGRFGGDHGSELLEDDTERIRLSVLLARLSD